MATFTRAEIRSLLDRSPWLTRPGFAASWLDELALHLTVESFVPGDEFQDRQLRFVVSGRVAIEYGFGPDAHTVKACAGDLVNLHDWALLGDSLMFAREALGAPVVEKHRAETHGVCLVAPPLAALQSTTLLTMSGLFREIADILGIRTAWPKFARWCQDQVPGLGLLPASRLWKLAPSLRTLRVGAAVTTLIDELFFVVAGYLSAQRPASAGGISHQGYLPGTGGGLGSWTPTASPIVVPYSAQSGFGVTYVLSLPTSSARAVGFITPAGTRPPPTLALLGSLGGAPVGTGAADLLAETVADELGANVLRVDWLANGSLRSVVGSSGSFFGSGTAVTWSDIAHYGASWQPLLFRIMRGVEVVVVDASAYVASVGEGVAAAEFGACAAQTSIAWIGRRPADWHRRLLDFGGDLMCSIHPVVELSTRRRAWLLASMFPSGPVADPWPDETVRIRPSAALAGAPSPTSATTGDRKAFGRIGRCLLDRMVGVALGGAGALSFTALPLLREMERLGIPIDYVSGTSFGAYLGGFYTALGLPGLRKLEQQSPLLSWLLPGALITNRHLGPFVDWQTDQYDLRDTAIPFLPVATDAVNYGQAPIRDGSIGFGVRASGALPPASPVARRGKRMLDGAFSDDIPGQLLRDSGCDLVVGANPFAAPDVIQLLSELVLGGMRFGDLLIELSPVLRAWDYSRSQQRMSGFMGSHSIENLDITYTTGIGPTFAQGSWFSLGPAIAARAARTRNLRLAVAETQAEWRRRLFVAPPRWKHDAANKRFALEGHFVFEPQSGRDLLTGVPSVPHPLDHNLLDELADALAASAPAASSLTLVATWDLDMRSLPWWWRLSWLAVADLWMRRRQAELGARGLAEAWPLYYRQRSIRGISMPPQMQWSVVSGPKTGFHVEYS